MRLGLPVSLGRSSVVCSETSRNRPNLATATDPCTSAIQRGVTNRRAASPTKAPAAAARDPATTTRRSRSLRRASSCRSAPHSVHSDCTASSSCPQRGHLLALLFLQSVMHSARSNANASVPAGPTMIQTTSAVCRLTRNGVATAKQTEHARSAPPINRTRLHASAQRVERRIPTVPTTTSATPSPTPYVDSPPSSRPSTRVLDACKTTDSPIPSGTPPGNAFERLGGSRVIGRDHNQVARRLALGSV